MGKSKILGGGASNVVNGIIEQYYAATDDVKANTFVEYINQYSVTKPTEVKNLTTDSAPYSIDATMLTDNKVLVVYTVVATNIWYVKGIVCTIENNVITPGTAAAITSNFNRKIQNVVVLTLTSTKVAIVFSTDADSNAKTYAQICSISDKTITAGTYKEITVGTGNFGNAIASKLTDSSFIIVGSSGNLYAIACTVTDMSFTVGQSVIIRSSSDSTQRYYDIDTLTNNKVIVTYAGAPQNSILYLCVKILTVSGSTITVGTQYALGISGYSVPTRVAALSPNKAVVCCGSYLDYAVVCTISGTVVTFGTPLHTSSADYDLRVAKLNERTVARIVPNSGGTSVYLLKVQDSVITIQSPNTGFIVVRNPTKDLQKLKATLYKDSCFCFTCVYSSNQYPVAQLSQLLDYEGIQELTDSAKFLGLTQSKATKTTKGKVWVLKKGE